MKRQRQNRFCSGQATTEMAIMLLAFVILMLGLIFVFSLGIFNTKVLMNAKYNADAAANGDNAVNAAGAELLRLADGRNRLDEIARKAGLEEQVEDVAQFYLTLGNAGYLENRFEVNLIAVEM